MSELSEEDKSLFAQAMEGTKPINNENKVFHQSKPITAKQATRKNQSDFADHAVFTDSLDDSEKVSAFESLFFSRAGLRIQDLNKLKKGEFTTHWTLDLHGLTETEADKTLKEFMRQAIEGRARYLIVVHGKGYNSDLDFPILKNLVNQRLRQIPQMVAFVSALPKDGGTGAVYVLLKNQN